MDRMTILTNSTARKDFIKNELTSSVIQGQHIFIAVAFFTDYDTVEQLCRPKNRVDIVVRLGYPTSPMALRRLFQNDNVNVGFYTSSKYHPKLYIFDDFALVGSANLTHSALTVNQEIVLKVPASTQEYDDLKAIFDGYWAEAEPLTSDYLAKYEVFCRNNRHPSEDALERKIFDEIGYFEYKNITTGNSKARTAAQKATSAYHKNYQNCRHALADLQSRYEAQNIRKGEPGKLPIRLELDTFISWVMDNKGTGSKWEKQIPSEEREATLTDYFEEWRNAPATDVVRAQDLFQKITDLFASPKNLHTASYDKIMDSLICLHSVYSRLRYFPGGLDTLIAKFKRDNPEEKVKSTLEFLIFGKGDIIDRMYNAIYNPTYRLIEFSKSGVQELVGWVNNDIAIVNGRTTKVLHHLGYEVRQIDEQLL